MFHQEQNLDIVEYPANLTGKDYLIGDIHGNSDSLDEVLNKLKPRDRLFLVGDLIDRGKANLGVLKKVMGSPNIFSVRGNHEEMTLDTIFVMEEIIKNLTRNGGDANSEIGMVALCAMENPFIWNHADPLNGGEWLLELFTEELGDEKILVNNDDVDYSRDSEIKKIKDFFSTLPYIIRVCGEYGKSGFYVVHADPPFNDKELRRRIAKQTGLSAKEKKYCLWAGAERDIALKENGRNFWSTITYCGHDIIFRAHIKSVRRQTNTIDIDVGSFMVNIFLLINHTDKTAEFIGRGNPDFAKREGVLNQQLDLVTTHLQEQKELERLVLREIYSCDSFTEVRAMLDLWRRDYYYFYVQFLINNDALKKFNINSILDFHREVFQDISLHLQRFKSVEEVHNEIKKLAENWPQKKISYEYILMNVLPRDFLEKITLSSVEDSPKLEEREAKPSVTSIFQPKKDFFQQTENSKSLVPQKNM